MDLFIIQGEESTIFPIVYKISWFRTLRRKFGPRKCWCPLEKLGEKIPLPVNSL